MTAKRVAIVRGEDMDAAVELLNQHGARASDAWDVLRALVGHAEWTWEVKL